MFAATNSTKVQQYRMDPARFARMRRRMLARLAVVAPFLVVVGWYLFGHLSRGRDLFDFIVLPVTLAWETYQAVQRERGKWNSLVLEFRGDNLIRTLPRYPTLEIAPSEVTAIVEFSGGIIVRTNSRGKTLIVSDDLLGYDNFRNRLAAWVPKINLVRRAPSLMGFASMLWCVLIFGGPLYLMYTPHRELILPLGIGLFIGMAATVWYYQRSPMMPTSFRKASWVLLLLPLLATVSRLSENR
jgi:hypothetical protein